MWGGNMRTSELYLIGWMFTGLILLIIDLLMGAIFILSGILLRQHHAHKRREYNKVVKKDVPYVN